MPSSHSLPNSLLLLIVLLVTIFFGNVNSTFVHYSGHVYCNVSTAADGTSNTAEGSLVLPVKNVYMALMEADAGLFDSDDQLGTCRTDADGSFGLAGGESEIDGLEPYLIVKACRTDYPSNCRVEKHILKDSNGHRVMVVDNADIFVENEFCRDLCKGGVCQSA